MLLLQENSKNKERKIDFSNKNESQSYSMLGQYVPVHKLDISEKNINLTKKITNPIIEKKEAVKTTFDIYDGDYLKNQFLNNDTEKSGIGKTIWNHIKYLFLNLPIINILYLKNKQLKIKETISKLDIMSSDIDNYSNFLRNKYILNEEKYRQICSDLVKTVKIQTEINNNLKNTYKF